MASPFIQAKIVTSDSNNNLSTDSTNSIVGKNNIVDGIFNDLVGNKNLINNGNFNQIRGDQNVINNGDNNVILSDGSFVVGSRNIIY